jgi:phospholipid transport system substrate-binding protein
MHNFSKARCGARLAIGSLLLATVAAAPVAAQAFNAGAVSARAAHASGMTATKAATAKGTAQQSGATGFIAHMGQQALDFLRNEKLGQQGKEGAFRKLLQDSFDMETIGRFTAGQYWRQMTPAQQQEYQRLFREYVVQVYSARFNQYSGQDFTVTGTGPSDSQTDTIVQSNIVGADGGAPVNVDWRVRNKGGHMMVVDVLVEGVSMSQTQRSDFASVIQRGGGNVSVLIDQLRQQTKHG